jgi:hypothetical protein
MKSIKLFILFLVVSLSTSAQTAFDDSAKVFMNEVNSVRSNPKAFKDFLVLYASKNVIYKSGVGLEAFKEAIAFLDTVRPVDTLTYSESIFKAIGDHTGIDTVTGVVKHDRKCLSRINKYDNSFKVAGENFALVTKTGQIGGKKKTTKTSMKEVLADFIIDLPMYNQKDFKSSHREAIFNSRYKFTAVKLVKVKDKIYLFQEFGGY